MNFRAFKPQIINEFHPQSISNIPIMKWIEYLFLYKFLKMKKTIDIMFI